jgi:TolB-like protein
MKKFCLIIFAAFLSLNMAAQTRNATTPDVIQKINGEEMKGKVTKITDTDVSFIYSGETLEYAIKKSDILKIVHSSGRVEVFNQPPLPSQDRQKDAVSMTATPVDHHNKIAILPFTYLMDNQPGADQVGLKAQDDAYSILAQHSAGYTILDPRTTNAMLIQAGVTKDKMMGFTMKNICDILGVEYIIDGSVIQAKGYATSYSGGNTDTNVKRDDADKINKVSSSNSSYTNAAQRYDVSVNLHIYMDNNASIYNESHKAFFTNTDGSYSSPLEYLLKRSPLYRK